MSSRASQAGGPHIPCWPLGWGLLIGWGLCILFHDSYSQGASGTRAVWIASAVSSATAFALIAWHQDRSSAGQVPRIRALMAAGAGMAAVTLLFVAATPLPLPAHAVLAAASGVLDAWLTVAWGLAYARLGPERIELYAALSVIPIAICFLAVALLPTPAVQVMATALPLASAALLARGAHALAASTGGASEAESADVAPAARHDAPAPGIRRLGVSAAALSAAIALLWTSERMGLAGQDSTAYNLCATVGVMAAGCLVAACATFARRLDLGTFLRLIMPLLFAGLALAALRTPAGSLLSYADAMLCQVLLGLAMLVHFTELDSPSQRDVARNFSLGQLALQVGLACGYLLSLALEHVVGPYPAQCAPVALCMCTVLGALLPSAIDAARPPMGKATTAEEAREDNFARRCGEVAVRFGLTPREAEVMEMLARGHGLSYVRNCLAISKSTAGTHAQHIYRKCGVHGREELMELVENEP